MLGRVSSVVSCGESLVFLQQFFLGFDMGRIQWNTVHRAYLLALRFVIVANTLGALRRIDLVDHIPLVNRLIGALRLQ